MTITFDNPPQPPGTYTTIAEYAESGMLFTGPPYTMVLVGNGLAGAPNDGTTYLGTSINTTITVSSLSGVPFGLIAFDVANDNGVFTPPTVQVVGFRAWSKSPGDCC